MKKRKPVVALVGRPNVGKSTLFNRLTGARTAIVEDLPGTTRDRLYGETEWNGRAFIVIDTGGLEAQAIAESRAARPGAPPLARDSAQFVTEIQNQAQLALEEADVIVFVVDGKEGLTAADEDLADQLRQGTKPLILAVNKAESPERQLNAAEFWALGLGEPIPISAYHGIGVGDLLDQIVEVLPEAPPEREDEEETIGIAIVGRPNVGKSSLLNALIGQERAIVSDIAGTTRDPIDTELVYDGQRITLIDTAGIRRRGRVEPGIEKYSVLRSMRSIDRADVALLLLDATEGVTAQDMHVAGYVLERNKGVVVLVNKWDALEKDAHTMVEYTRKVRQELKFMDYVPVLFISALTRQRVNRVLPTALAVAAERTYRIPTSELNQIIQEAYDRHPPATKLGRPLRIYYATQVDVRPPTFVLFVNDPELAHFSYVRYLENQVRAHHPFTGTPIRILLRPRNSDSRN
ncbi:MAG: ribosome biogenesis GTPase Der [Caldilineae bacterium]|nr:MAG: ribosome biogenesis GTPase Der [Caldilineae bacterium]